MGVGTAEELEAIEESLTGAALRGELRLDAPTTKPPIGKPVRVTGAKVHNLKGVSFGAHLGQLTGVCGPSGSGKSSLVLECFVPAIAGESSG